MTRNGAHATGNDGDHRRSQRRYVDEIHEDDRDRRAEHAPSTRQERVFHANPGDRAVQDRREVAGRGVITRRRHVPHFRRRFGGPDEPSSA